MLGHPGLDRDVQTRDAASWSVGTRAVRAVPANQVKRTTEITQRRGAGEDPERRVKTTDQDENEKLAGYFFRALNGACFNNVNGAPQQLLHFFLSSRR